METIKKTIHNVIKGLVLKKEGVVEGGDPEALLKKAMTKEELKHIKFNYLRKGILGLRVDSSAWLYNLNLKKESLLAGLNKEPGVTIKDIRFFIGELR